MSQENNDIKIKTKIEYLIDGANKNNKSKNENKGTGDDRDQIEYNEDIIWKYKNIYPKFILKEGTPEFMYHLLQYKNDNSNSKALVILPGFSEKSRDWTFGRINRFINSKEKLKEYSDIIIFDFNEIKPLMNEQNFGKDSMKNFYKEKIDNNIGKNLNHILNSFKFSDINLIGRSAGGGLAIYLSSLNEKISKLYLACPGWNNDTVNPLLEVINNNKKKLEIKLYHSKKDTYIKISESHKLNKIFNDNNISHTYKELEINDKEGNAFHHRIHEVLIDDLIESL